ncbi:putative F28H1.4a [Operophtera brumata]|uniref:Putative F28H1.4a n=1 Tax=Operophtera brumata TaxID=104452 RepID=A0A0L7KMT7_OPEBR|nr:putative F28H1.4a [Operophtera brumata]
MFDNYGNNQAAQPQPPPSSPTRVVRFDKSYVQSTPGILKLVEIICNIVGFICIKVSPAWFSAFLYNLLYWAGNIITILLLVMYTFHLVEKFDKLPWLKFEFSFCVIMVLMYIGCSIFATTIAESAGYAVGFFGLCAIIAYGMDGYLKFKAYRRGLPPQ